MKLDNRTENSFKLFYKGIFRGRNIVFLVLLTFLFAGYVLSNKLKSKGYSGVVDFVQTVVNNYFEGLKADPEELSVEIKNDDFKKLEKLRKQALERGVIINDQDGEYVPAVLHYQGKDIEVKLRLKGHMTDHLQDNKWSFRIKTKGNDHFMGMKRFSIQHPGTRGYIYEWIYHELMKREDVISLRYKFINVMVNGKDWGIYAVEENFESELVENNKRIKAPILRFNPDLYWVNRYNMSNKESSFDEFASYYSANPEAYRENKVLADTVQKKYYLKAIALIEGLRSRKIEVHEAFDIKRLARFHAIIDLVGGMHSIDWSDIKYYYNPVNATLEPVAYESFTNLESRNISSAYRFVNIDSTSNYTDWHEMIFSNRFFFAEYIKELERICQPEYLDSFFSESNNELQKNLRIIYKEFPYKKFDPTLYYKRQKQLIKILDAPKALHAYFIKCEDSILEVQLASIDAFPVLVNSITVGKAEIRSEKDIILPAKLPKTYVDYQTYRFKVPHGVIINDTSLENMKVNYRIPGSSIKKQAVVFPFPHTDSEYLTLESNNKEGVLSETNILEIDEVNKIISFKKGVLIIRKNITIPSGYKVFCDNRTKLDLRDHAGIISYSPLLFKGFEDDPIVVESGDSTGNGLLVVNSLETSVFENVIIKKMGKEFTTSWKRNGSLVFYESPVSFKNCSFYNGASGCAVEIIRSEYFFDHCFFTLMNNALEISYSKGIIQNSIFENCKKNGLVLTMSRSTINKTYFNKITKKCLQLKGGSQVKASNLNINNSFIAVSAEDGSEGNFNNIKINSCEIGFAVFKNKKNDTESIVDASGVQFIHVNKNYIKEKSCVLKINGLPVSEEVKDIDNQIKNDKESKK